MNFEIKNFTFEIKAMDDNTFEGYASVFRNVDSYRDVIEPGAFTKTISEGSKRVKILWQHDPYQPIGVPTFMEEDNHGLFVKGRISETALGKDVKALMKDGVINELSIGYNTIKDEFDNEKNVRRIKEVKLWEFSPVTFAANDAALITGVKNRAGLVANIKALNNMITDEVKNGRTLDETAIQEVKNMIQGFTALLNGVEPDKNHSKTDEKAAADIFNLINEMKAHASK